MEHESFENDAVAAVLNEHFVPIKVDREERPDVDRVYMTLRAGHDRLGRLADERVAHAGTEAVLRRHLLPADVAMGPARVSSTCCARSLGSGTPSASKVIESARASPTHLQSVQQAGAGWRRARRRGAARSSRSSQHVRSRGTAASATRRSSRGRASCCSCCASTRAPAMTTRATWRWRTLRAMALGGMRDHIGGGFHRYSVDARVAGAALREDALRPGAARARVPRGAQVSGDRFTPKWPKTRCGTCMREMTDEAADSFRPRTPTAFRPSTSTNRTRTRSKARSTSGRADEVDALLGDDAGDRQGALRDRADRQCAGGSAAGVRRQEPALSAESIDDLGGNGQARRRQRRRRCGARLRMFAAAAPRPRPHLDDKVLTAWNGLMIARVRAAARVCRDGRRTRADAVSRRGPPCRVVPATSACGTPTAPRCCGAIATAKPASRATPKTTRT